VLLGNADDIVLHLSRKLGWDLPPYPPTRTNLDAPTSIPGLKKRPSGDLDSAEPQRVGKSHVWLFEGAEGGKWVEDLAQQAQETREPSMVDESSSSELDDPSYKSGPVRRRPKKARTT